MSHTPGPWRLKESPHKREFSYFIDAGPGVGSYFIAAVNNGTGPDEANAKLIVAAPELLKACSTAASALRSYQYGNASTDLAEEVADFIEAAIAKATA